MRPCQAAGKTAILFLLHFDFSLTGQIARLLPRFPERVRRHRQSRSGHRKYYCASPRDAPSHARTLPLTRQNRSGLRRKRRLSECQKKFPASEVVAGVADPGWFGGSTSHACRGQRPGYNLPAQPEIISGSRSNHPSLHRRRSTSSATLIWPSFLRRSSWGSFSSRSISWRCFSSLWPE